MVSNHHPPKNIIFVCNHHPPKNIIFVSNHHPPKNIIFVSNHHPPKNVIFVCNHHPPKNIILAKCVQKWRKHCVCPSQSGWGHTTKYWKIQYICSRKLRITHGRLWHVDQLPPKEKSTPSKSTNKTPSQDKSSASFCKRLDGSPGGQLVINAWGGNELLVDPHQVRSLARLCSFGSSKVVSFGSFFLGFGKGTSN